METREAVYHWSGAVRINHWLMAATIVFLIITGFYIAHPSTVYKGETTDKFFMGSVTFWHALAGIVLTLLFVWRSYLAFFSRFKADWKDYFAWTDWRCMYSQVRYYLLIDTEEPSHGECIFGPVQSLSYLVLWLGIIAIIITGFILMGANDHSGLSAAGYWLFKPFLKLMGNLAVVRYIHHILTWFFILFIMVHVYMAFWYDAVLGEGTVSSMIGGRLFERIRRTEP